ncbi:MAG TPA: adenylate/guanylate cyclase domain-containing protein, partial [Chthoniobacterales bacterium]|nr:adenylate/guanylate cyclase domain-containing protein [Chthoniobacterales bacterium]
MAGDTKGEIELEIGHVLFVDIVGYTKLLINEQLEHLEKLRELVRATETFRTAQSEGKLMRLPTGDGGALVFRTNPEAPVKCAIEIARELKKHPELRVRMGIHSGPVKDVTDLSEQGNIAGAGINIAQRVMDCGDAGHILLSKRVADDLEQYARWRPLLHDLGSCEVKHAVSLALFNLYSDEFGNPECPKRLGRGGKVESQAATASSPTPRKSIAVLPFKNLSEEKANVYFADGIQEEILTRLSRIGDLKVISRTSTQQFENPAGRLPEIAKQLGVANILEGSVRKAGDKVRVHVQLIDAENDAHLWAERYDRQLTDIFEVESDIAASIADALQAKLTGAERRAICAQPTTNVEAHQLYLQGRYHWRNFLAPGYERVREYFEQAVALDRSYAPAYAGLSLYYSFAAANGIFPPDAWPPGEDNMQKALELDSTLGEALNSLAAVNIYYKRDWTAAQKAFKRGAELNPNFADIKHHYGVVLTLMGRKAEALEQMHRAMALDPFFPGLNLHYGKSLFFMGEYDLAVAHFAKMLDRNPNYAAAHEYFGDVCEQKGMQHEAITQWTAALALSGRSEDARVLEQVFASAGFEAAKRTLALRELEELDRKRAQGEYVAAAHHV